MRAKGKERESALYFDEMGDQKVPVGFGRDGNPVYLNFEFATQVARFEAPRMDGSRRRCLGTAVARPPEPLSLPRNLGSA